MQTTNEQARVIALRFDEIRQRGGHAAIDFCDGELLLRCTQPTDNPKTWGRGAVPQPYTDKWVRLAEV